MEAMRFITYYEATQQIANRIIKIRKSRHISRKRLSDLSGVPYGSIRRFEETGDISLASLIKIAFGLGLYDDVEQLFNKRIYKSIEEVINEQD